MPPTLTSSGSNVFMIPSRANGCCRFFQSRFACTALAHRARRHRDVRRHSLLCTLRHGLHAARDELSGKFADDTSHVKLMSLPATFVFTLDGLLYKSSAISFSLDFESFLSMSKSFDWPRMFQPQLSMAYSLNEGAILSVIVPSDEWDPPRSRFWSTTNWHAQVLNGISVRLGVARQESADEHAEILVDRGLRGGWGASRRRRTRRPG